MTHEESLDQIRAHERSLVTIREDHRTKLAMERHRLYHVQDVATSVLVLLACLFSTLLTHIILYGVKHAQ